MIAASWWWFLAFLASTFGVGYTLGRHYREIAAEVRSHRPLFQPEADYLARLGRREAWAAEAYRAGLYRCANADLWNEFEDAAMADDEPAVRRAILRAEHRNRMGAKP